MKTQIKQLLIERGEGLLDDEGVDVSVAEGIADATLDLLRPHLCIRILRASKRTRDDDYNEGCCGNERERVLELHRASYPSVVSAFRDIVHDKSITGDRIITFDPNIYCDTRAGETRTVEDNVQRGHFRCLYDRMESQRGGKPSKVEMVEFEAGRLKLRLADYEIIFVVELVGIDEAPLAELLGVNNW